MAVGKDQFDADLEAERAATVDYIAACDAVFTNPNFVDFAAEDATVTGLLQAVNDARGRVPVAPPPPPKPG